MSVSKNWCFTLNAVGREKDEWPALATPELPPVMLYDPGLMQAIFYQLERAPTTGEPHLQGFMISKKNCRLTGVKKMLPNCTHWEIMRGTVMQSVEYCSKSDTKIAGPWQFGDLPTGKGKGKRTDWSDVKEEIAAGHTKKQILLEHPHLAPCAKGIDALIWANKPAPPLCRDIQVWFLYGPTDTGKTHRAYTAFPNAFKVKGKYFEGKSFDMYDGQEVLILDEWSPFEWPLTLMNSLLDKWECQLQCRYENKYAYWTKVIIATNFAPTECYTSVPVLQRASFTRRLTYKIEILDKYDPVVDFKNAPLVIPGRDDCSSQLPDPDAALVFPDAVIDVDADEPQPAAYAPPDVHPIRDFTPVSLFAIMNKNK